MPDPRGLYFVVAARVDADHSGDIVTRRSSTGYIIYVKSAPIYWKSKKQTRRDCSYVGNEFITMKQYCECICGLHYLLLDL